MKKRQITLILFNFIFLYSNSQNLPDIVTSFKNMVAQVDEVFRNTPVVLATSDYKSSPSGKVYYKLQFQEIDLKYDVQKTTSLISPYSGYILITVKVKTNAKSGDVKGYDDYVGFADSTNARQNNLYETCTVRTYDIDEWCVGELKVNYAYQNDKWKFIDIETETTNKIAAGIIRGDIKRGILESIFKNLN